MNEALERTLASAQYLLPHHALSRLIFYATRSSFAPWKNLLIRSAIKAFDIDMNDALLKSPSDYRRFADFFTRELEAGARPQDADPASITSPADGRLMDYGLIEEGQIIEAKGRSYSVEQLLGSSDEAEAFKQGCYTSLYLSPRDYHRVHMPVAGSLMSTRYIPGRLFSVAPYTVRHIPGLFARNERLVCQFDTTAGPMALVMVGAMLVSGIETVWEGEITPRYQHEVHEKFYSKPSEKYVVLRRGQEMGRFNMGSSVVLLFGNRKLEFAEDIDGPIKMGEKLASIDSPIIDA